MRLPARVAINLGLVIHELTTNAAKYGALSAPGGRVAVEWRVKEGELELVWRESGGSAVAPPSRRGFGSRLIERSITGELGGSAETRFEVEGLVCALSIPLSAEADGTEEESAGSRRPDPSRARPADPLTVAV